jgi:hypothetical protein
VLKKHTKIMVIKLSLKIGCPQTSVTNYQSMMHNIPQERKPRNFQLEFLKACDINITMKARLKACVNKIKINIKN